MQELTNLLALLKKLEVDHCELARQAMNGTPHAHLELAITIAVGRIPTRQSA